jgi:hypothetical protein
MPPDVGTRREVSEAVEIRVGLGGSAARHETRLGRDRWINNGQSRTLLARLRVMRGQEIVC